MSGDYIGSLGALVLDHRFKRMMNRLLQEAADIYRDFGLEFKPRWVSTSLLLFHEGPLTVTELARRLKLTHPAVIQVVGGMQEAGLVRDEADPEDGRRRLLRMSREGRCLMPKLQRIWDEMSRAQEEVFQAAGCQVMKVMDEVEARLDAKSIRQRVVERLGKQQAASSERRGLPHPLRGRERK